MPERECPYCGKTKPEEDFPTREKGALKRRRACHDCHLAKRRKQWKEHDQKRNAERRRRWHEDPEYRARNREACRRYREKNGEKRRKAVRDLARANRRIVIEKYGGRCVCCGEDAWEFLAIDHINSDGAADRKRRGGAVALYRWLAKQNPQDGYQLLCANCNTAIAFYGYCPHGNLPRRKPVNSRGNDETG